MKILSFSKIVDLIFGIAKWDDFFSRGGARGGKDAANTPGPK